MVMNYRKQRGSAVIIITSVAAVVLLILLLGNMSLFTRELNNEAPALQTAYLNKAQNALEQWYRKNARLIDDVACPAYTEDQLFAQTMIQKEFGAKMEITPCLSIDGPLIKYRNVTIWIPAVGIPDTGTHGVSGVFQPGNNQVVYRTISGKGIEANLVAETRGTLLEMARALESRFKSKIEGDPDRDLRINYFKPMNCLYPMGDEIPCSSSISSDGYAPLSDGTFSALKLAELSSISQSAIRDSWGQPIVFNNVVMEPGNKCVPSGDPNTPPFAMMLTTKAPWGADITVCPVQPVN